MPYNLRTRLYKQPRGRKPYNFRSRGERTVNDESEAHSPKSTPTSSLNSVPENPSSDGETDDEQVTQSLSSNEETDDEQETQSLLSNEETDDEQVTQNPSSNEECVHDLSVLNPPSGSNGFSTEKDLKVLKEVSVSLISGIQEAADANEMIDLSSKAFAYFDSLGGHHMPLYKAVRAVIHYQCDKETLAKQNLQDAYDTKAAHEQAASELSKAEERYSGANRECEDAQHESDASKACCKRLYDQEKKANEVNAKHEAEVGALEADEVTCVEACSKAKSELEKIDLGISEAQKTVDDYERQCQEINNGFNRAMRDISCIRSSLQ